MKTLIKNSLFFIIIFLIISGLFSFFISGETPNKEITLDQFVSLIQNNQIKELVVDRNKLNLLLSDGQRKFAFKEESETLGDVFKNYNIPGEKIEKIKIKVKPPTSNFWLNFVPLLGGVALMIFFFIFLNKQLQKGGVQAMKFGESGVREIRPEEQINKKTFKDVAGVKEAKEELKEIVDFLKKPEKFIKLGAKIPKGVLLIGAPGVGKTLLAKAVAGEANVPFFHISGSEFIELFVGIGASRVRDAFKKAKKNVPSILFIDELDAIGRLRGAGLSGSHDEREQTLNQILVELDGFEPNIGLVVLSATNRPDVLDPALLRPGRFDRKVILDMPDVKDREKILKIHSRGKPLATDIKIEEIAQRTPGFTGADLANLMNEAAILAAVRNKNQIAQKELLESIEKVILGPERKSFILGEKEKKVIAFHETGHAVVTYNLSGSGEVRKISVIARGRAAGYTIKAPKEVKYLFSRTEIINEITSLLGGYASEKIFFNEVTSGAAEDLKEVTKTARKIVTQYGMSEILGPRTFGKEEELIFLGKEFTGEKDYSEKTAQLIDKEMAKIIDFCYNKALEIIKKNKEKIKKIADYLTKKETIEKEEFEKLMA